MKKKFTFDLDITLGHKSMIAIHTATIALSIFMILKSESSVVTGVSFFILGTSIMAVCSHVKDLINGKGAK
ncbi:MULTISPECIES: hypothetical protein [Bacillus cereus group]|uniref:hypothetical protein n=1 Tax=Bacillus cereus group TaxID=86661 RepID=UPI000BEDE742|nr:MULTISPECIES: hypothetical protein [Bacillus cereus group]PEF88544.1 hypothetical protein CON51_04900 [Bacillus thuringiensis]PES54721.1 hypothetical protein CN506_19700 [Bacillus thuringiensis]PFP03587.1 hypothetical protein COJ91_22620 [Bacillus thuringiensis]PFS55677.1 hypothetical protein COK64_23310 [Bacillus thuringiensis]PGL62329.1 hypothetical protein CN939_19475 [Bacillus thuringiensis]